MRAPLSSDSRVTDQMVRCPNCDQVLVIGAADESPLPVAAEFCCPECDSGLALVEAPVPTARVVRTGQVYAGQLCFNRVPGAWEWWCIPCGARGRMDPVPREQLEGAARRHAERCGKAGT